MIRALLMVVALLPAAAIAQAPVKENPPPAKPPESPATDRPVLNLKLDNPSSWATTAPSSEKEAAKGLPTLGGDARRIEPPRGTATGRSDSPVFPKDTNPGR
jgi:hypothetical protein